MELRFLDFLQTIQTPLLDKILAFITSLGNAGIIWIVLAVVLLILPKTRKTGIIVAAALLMDLILCNLILKNLVARVRPYDVNTAIAILIKKPLDFSFPSGHTAASFAAIPGKNEKGMDCRTCSGSTDCFFTVVFLCALSDGCTGWSCSGHSVGNYRVHNR